MNTLISTEISILLSIRSISPTVETPFWEIVSISTHLQVTIVVQILRKCTQRLRSRYSLFLEFCALLREEGWFKYLSELRLFVTSNLKRDLATWCFWKSRIKRLGKYSVFFVQASIDANTDLLLLQCCWFTKSYDNQLEATRHRGQRPTNLWMRETDFEQLFTKWFSLRKHQGDKDPYKLFKVYKLPRLFNKLALNITSITWSELIVPRAPSPLFHLNAHSMNIFVDRFMLAISAPNNS